MARNIPYLRQQAERAGRDPDKLLISLKRSVHFTDLGVAEGISARSGGTLVASTQDIIDDVNHCWELGIGQLTYDFRVDSLDGSIRVMEHLAREVMPVARRLA